LKTLFLGGVEQVELPSAASELLLVGLTVAVARMRAFPLAVYFPCLLYPNYYLITCLYFDKYILKIS
jgi:hypothetical protein